MPAGPPPTMQQRVVIERWGDGCSENVAVFMFRLSYVGKGVARYAW
jgi:hypothetical protein